MKKSTKKILTAVFLTLALIAVAFGQVRIVSTPNFTLTNGETVSKTLFLLSQNAELQAGSSVDGSVVMLCCNLTVSGDVTGDVWLLTGNLWINAQANVNGDVSVVSGNLSK